MIKITLESTQAVAKIQQIARQLEKPRALYGVLGEALKKIHNQRFKEQKAPDGTKWKPVSPEYAVRKKKNGKGSRILRYEGNLSDRTAYNFDDQGVEFGSPMKYARIHQYGGKTGRGKRAKIPARPWLGLSSSDEKFLLDKATRHLSKVISQIAR